MNLATQSTERKYAHVLRPLTQDERKLLRASIQKHGLLQSLVFDQHGDLLDGHHREELCAELGIEPHQKIVTTDDPVNWIKSNQKARRNLNREEMRMLIEEQLIAKTDQTDNAIAKVVGVSHVTVGKVRAKLEGEGTIDNVVRIDKRGYRASGGRQPSTCQPDKSDQSEAQNSTRAHLAAVKEQKMAEAQERFFSALKNQPPAEKPTDEELTDHDAPPPIERHDSGFTANITDNIIYHFADDNTFHSLASIRKKLDPDGAVGLNDQQIKDAMKYLRRGKDARVEERPAAHGQKRYCLYRQGKSIGLDVLKTKFRPVIEALIAEGNKPISHQSTGRFLDGARMLRQLLRDLEAE